MKCIILLKGGHRTTVRWESANMLREAIEHARKGSNHLFNPAGSSVWVDPEEVVAVVADDDGIYPAMPMNVRYRLSKLVGELDTLMVNLEKQDSPVAVNLRVMIEKSKVRGGDEVIIPVVDELGTSPGSAARERQEQDALTIIPTERLLREYLHRVVRQVRENSDQNDYQIVSGVLEA